ncbi:MAG: hypothetical protein ACJ71W_22195 [Terriglobales bacterium]
MLANLSSFDVFLWLTIALGQTILSAIIMRRRMDRRYLAFCCYIYFSTLKTWILISIPSGHAWLYFWLSYACSVTACILMAMAVGELYRKTFAPGWARVPAWVPRNVAAWLAGAISSCAVLAIALRPMGWNRYAAVMAGIQAALVSAILISLVILALYARHLGITWRPWPLRIACGFIFFLGVNATTMHMLGITSRETAETVRRLGQIAYLVSLLWWGGALWGIETVPTAATAEQIADMVSEHRRTVTAAARLTEV